MGLPARKMEKTYTYADYCTWPDDERWELIAGVAWNMSPAPSSYHQLVTGSLFNAIYNQLQNSDCTVIVAPFDVLLPDFAGQEEEEVINVVQPDITVICEPKKITPRGCYGAPDWVIEILSPYTSKKDLREKFDLYEKHGIREYWVVDPGNRYVHVYTLDKNGEYGEPEIFVEQGEIKSTVCEEFSIELNAIFPETDSSPPPR